MRATAALAEEGDQAARRHVPLFVSPEPLQTAL